MKPLQIKRTIRDTKALSRATIGIVPGKKIYTPKPHKPLKYKRLDKYEDL